MSLRSGIFGGPRVRLRLLPQAIRSSRSSNPSTSLQNARTYAVPAAAPALPARPGVSDSFTGVPVTRCAPAVGWSTVREHLPHGRLRMLHHVFEVPHRAKPESQPPCKRSIHSGRRTSCETHLPAAARACRGSGCARRWSRNPGGVSRSGRSITPQNALQSFSLPTAIATARIVRSGTPGTEPPSGTPFPSASARRPNRDISCSSNSWWRSCCPAWRHPRTGRLPWTLPARSASRMPITENSPAVTSVTP